MIMTICFKLSFWLFLLTRRFRTCLTILNFDHF